MEKVRVDIGICAYNEERNIAKLLDSILAQKTDRVCIEEIVVVSDGSTDRTDEIVKQVSRRSRITFMRNESRLGKYAAVNKFLEYAGSSVLVLASADIILHQDAIENLCRPFIGEGKMGMAGAHPVPVNPGDNFLGYVVNLQWGLHHELSLIKPKFGELVAFRNIIGKLPPTSVDEEHIAFCLNARGYGLKYAPDAVIFNKGPENIGDFLRQRRRIYAGHLLLKINHHYEASTLSGIRILMLLLKQRREGLRKNIIWLIGAIFLEAAARMLATFDFILKRDHSVWKIAASTKNPYN